MAGTHSQTLPASSGAVNGTGAAYAVHTSASQENSSQYKPPSTNGTRSAVHGPMSRTPLTSVTANGKSAHDSGYVGSNRNGPNERHGGISRSESDADSLLDLYGSNRNLSNMDSDIPENMYKPEEAQDPEGWIHRDKLAKIESEELQAAGINLANARQSMSKGSRRPQSREQSDRGGGTEVNQRPGREEKEKLQRSPPVVEDPEEEEDKRGWDLRNPEEIAAEEAQRSGLPTPTLNSKKSGSRIPVLTSNPMPIPSERVERDTPLPRKRTLSGSMSPDEGTPAPKLRPRKNSSGILLDDGDANPAPGYRSGSAPSSPSKPKTIAKPTGTASPTTNTRKVTPAGIRKPSIPTKTGPTTNRNGTASPSQQRPSTRSGEGDRPRTAVNRPESDPPWLATMYKTDPRLPPDQQIIPTHARKQQQAQWNENGSAPSTYDREFAPLAVHNSSDGAQLYKSNSGGGVVDKPNTEDQEAWPLKPMPSVRSKHSDGGRPGTSGSITAGYSTMPKVAQQHGTSLGVKSPGSSIVGQSPVKGTFPSGVGPGNHRTQTQQFVEEEGEGGKEGKREKGCLACCVVM